QPDEGIHLNFQTKVPDQEMTLRPADLEFHYRNAYADVAIPESYERLLLDAIHGDATLFMRSDEIERAWEIMDPFLAATERTTARCVREIPEGIAVPHVTIEIRDAANRQLVTAIEVLSPTNKRGDGRSEYLAKRQRLLLSTAHLMEIDLLHQGQRVPMQQPLP